MVLVKTSTRGDAGRYRNRNVVAVKGCGCGLCTVREPCRVSSGGTGAVVSLRLEDADEVFAQLESLVECPLRRQG